MSNANSKEEGSKVKVKERGHLQDEDGSEIDIGVKDDVPATFTMDENVAMEESVRQVFGMVELVAEILSYLPTGDIKSCNGVSHLWRREARKLLLKKTRMDFGVNWEDIGLQVDSYIEEMGEDCHQSIGIHRLGYCDAEVLAMTKFGNKYGDKVQKLCMTMGNAGILRSFTNVTALSLGLNFEVAIPLIPQDLIMPSVKTLSVKILKGRSGVVKWWHLLLSGWFIVPNEGTGFGTSLFQMCPMIEYLNLDGETQPPFFELFEESAPPNRLTGLGLNGINWPYSERLFNSLGAMQLTVFKIDFYAMDENVILSQNRPYPSAAYELEGILAAFAPTLKHFKLCHIPAGSISTRDTTIQFPEMPKLEALEITHLSVPFCKFTFGGASALDYGIQFPVLRKLNIKSVDAVDAEDGWVVDPDGSLQLCEMFFPEGTSPSPTLTRLDVDCISDIKHGNNCKKEEGDCFCNKEGPTWNMLKRLITMCPNVKEFKKCGGWQW